MNLLQSSRDARVMQTIRAAYIIVAASLLTGCASRQELAAVDDGRCSSYGFTPGSEAYAQCRMQLDGQRDANRRAAINSIGSTPMVAPGVNTNRRTCTSRSAGGGTVETVCE